MDKVILTCAVTGSVNTPTMSPYLPITPEQIADDAVKAAEDGASVVHIHVRNPENGMPSPDLGLFGQVLKSIKGRSDVVICTTTGGGLGMTVEERLAVVPEFKPEMASFNMGSMNFSIPPDVITGAAEKAGLKEPRFPWEMKYAEMSMDNVFKNTFKDLGYICKTMKEHGTKPELECYDVGQIYNSGFIVRQGLLDLPAHVQFVMGIVGGIQPTTEDLTHMKYTADRVFGGKYTWSVIGAGRSEFPMGAVATVMGGHVRVGLEDNLYLSKGVLAKSNAELVEKMKRIIEDLGRNVATPDEARKMLGLKGFDKVKF